MPFIAERKSYLMAETPDYISISCIFVCLLLAHCDTTVKSHRQMLHNRNNSVRTKSELPKLPKCTYDNVEVCALFSLSEKVCGLRGFLFVSLLPVIKMMAVKFVQLLFGHKWTLHILEIHFSNNDEDISTIMKSNVGEHLEWCQLLFLAGTMAEWPWWCC